MSQPWVSRGDRCLPLGRSLNCEWGTSALRLFMLNSRWRHTMTSRSKMQGLSDSLSDESSGESKGESLSHGSLCSSINTEQSEFIFQVGKVENCLSDREHWSNVFLTCNNLFTSCRLCVIFISSRNGTCMFCVFVGVI